MKKFVDICVIVAGSFLLLACILLGVTYYMFLKAPEDSAENVIYPIEQDDADTIFAIDVNAAIGKVSIVHSDSFEIKAASVYADGFDVTISDGVLYIRQETENDIELFGWRFGYSTAISPKHIPSVTISVPYDCYFDYADIQLGIGKIYIDRLECDRLVSQVGIGKIEAGNLSVADESAVQVAIGSFSCTGLDAKRLYLENTVGIADIHVPESAPAFGVSYEKLFGFLKIRDKLYAGYISSSLTDPAADHRISLNCRANIITID